MDEPLNLTSQARLLTVKLESANERLASVMEHITGDAQSSPPQVPHAENLHGILERALDQAVIAAELIHKLSVAVGVEPPADRVPETVCVPKEEIPQTKRRRRKR